MDEAATSGESHFGSFEKPLTGKSNGSICYDVLFVADPRFEGGTSTALAEEIRAARKCGLRSGLLMVKGSLLGRANFWMHPDLQALLDDGSAEMVDPAGRVRTALTIVHHPTIFSLPPSRPAMVTTNRTVLVLHHPRLNRAGVVQYDLAAVVGICIDTFGCAVDVAPVSNIVRLSLPASLPDRASILDEDWYNILDLGGWRQRPGARPRYPVTIGRHARPDPQKWPDTRQEALLAYSPDPEFCRVRILGGGAYLKELYGELPANWEELPFSWTGIDGFLSSLDFYVYFHSSDWSEAFGRVILEAMAVGVPVILPKYMRDSFGDAALYCEPSEVGELIERLVGHQDRYELQVRRGMAFVSRYSHASFAERLQRLFALSPQPAVPAPSGSGVVRASRDKGRKKSILFVSTNGIGMGHLTQQMAIAARLPGEIEAVFATMSYAMKIVGDEGYLTHFISYHRHYGADPNRWNKAFREELFDLIAFTRPAAIAYDGSYPFIGLTEAIRQFPEIQSFWVRRPMWRDGHASGLFGSDAFDHIVEPGELAGMFDDGPTKPLQKYAYLTTPVLHIDPGDRLCRQEARARLGLPADAIVVALQLGSGRNFDMKAIREKAIDLVGRYKDAIVLELRSPIRASFEPEEARGTRHRILECFPSFQYSRAFDFAVAAAGYNNFHENIYGAIPTIFVPNEAEEMDVQLSRARFADIFGYGCLVRRDHQQYGLAETIERLMDPEERAEMARRCRLLPYRNGAADIARLMAQSAYYLRTDIAFARAAVAG